MTALVQFPCYGKYVSAKVQRSFLWSTIKSA